MSVRAPDPVTPAVASPVDPLAVLGQALLALRTSSDVATTCAIARQLRDPRARGRRVPDPPSRSAEQRDQALDETGAGVAYLPGAGSDRVGAPARDAAVHRAAERRGRRRRRAVERSVEALAAVPLFGGGTLHGILVVAFASPRRFLAAEQSMLQSIGDLLALAMDRAELQKAASHERRRAESLEHRLHEDEEASSHLMSVVAHEIRSPLTAIRPTPRRCSTASRIRARRGSRFLGIIGDECDRLALLVTDILELSRLEAGTRPLRLRALQPAGRGHRDRRGAGAAGARLPRGVRSRRRVGHGDRGRSRPDAPHAPEPDIERDPLLARGRARCVPGADRGRRVGGDRRGPGSDGARPGPAPGVRPLLSRAGGRVRRERARTRPRDRARHCRAARRPDLGRVPGIERHAPLLHDALAAARAGPRPPHRARAGVPS